MLAYYSNYCRRNEIFLSIYNELRASFLPILIRFQQINGFEADFLFLYTLRDLILLIQFPAKIVHNNLL